VDDERNPHSIVHLEQLWSIIWPTDDDLPLLFDLLASRLRRGFLLAEITVAMEELAKAGVSPADTAGWPLDAVLANMRLGTRPDDAAEAVARALWER
jgi:hypothetical protein